VQIVIMFAIGGAAGAASFTHVHNLAAAHRQGGWLAWADAIVLELMSIASGLEIRRRRRIGSPLGVSAVVLVCAVLLSLAAQVIQAEPTPIGWIAAAVPAAGFLTMVKIALGYHTTHPTTSQPAPDQTPTPITPVPGRDQAAAEPVRDRDGGTGDLHVLLPAARRAAADITSGGRKLSRPALAEALRGQGYAVSTARATALMKLLKTKDAADPDYDQPGIAAT
jgi:Protein of unknown function (DUF2637)